MPSVRDRCISLILENKPEYAMILLLNSYDLADPHEMTLAYKMWAQIKTYFHRNPQHVHPDYTKNISALIEQATPSDKEKLQKLLECSLHDRYKVFKLSRAYLNDLELDGHLKEILPALPAIYEFEPPMNFKLKARQFAVKEDEFRLSNGHQELCTGEQVMVVFQTATKFLEDLHSITSTSSCIAVIVCLQIVTGRRFNEIAETCIFAPIPSKPYQAVVQGLLKSDSIETQLHTIPILIPFSVLVQNMRNVRAYTNSHSLPNNYVKRTSEKLFGFPFIHGHLRNVYLELAWTYRYQSQFHAQATRAYFDQKALCHTPHLTSTMSYQKLQFL